MYQGQKSVSEIEEQIFFVLFLLIIGSITQSMMVTNPVKVDVKKHYFKGFKMIFKFF